MLRFLVPFACCLTVVAQEPAAATPTRAPASQLLWPDGAPGALGEQDKDRPKVLIHHAAAQTAAHPAIVVCPGGGYGGLAMDHEGQQIARWLNALGITAVILDYRHRGKGYGHPAPLQDAQRAIRLVRANAKGWHVDAGKIGVIGFSAGGHLASSVSVHHDGGDGRAEDPIERHSCRPDFAVLCYPVIAFGAEFTHKGSQLNLLGADAPAELVRELSSEQQVAPDTPPTFLWHTSADTVVPPKNSVVYYLALVSHGVQCELHVFEPGRHGLGLAGGQAAEAWPGLCQRWLQTRGILAP